MVDSEVSDLVGPEALDAPPLTPALNPALRLIPASADLVGSGTGTIGLGVFEAIVESVSEASDRLEIVAVACDESESRGSGVCVAVGPVSAVIGSPELDTDDAEALAKVACEDCTDSSVVGSPAVLDSIGTGTIGFGVLNASGSEEAGSEDWLVGADDTGCSDGSDNDVSVAVGATKSLDGNSVRLRLAVALAGELGSFSVVVVEGVVTFDSVGTGTTGTTKELEAPAEDNPSVD